MRPAEIIRIIVIVVIGAIVVFLVQPWLYQSGNIFLTDVDTAQWIENSYVPASIIVFIVTSATTFLWYGLSLKASPKRSSEMSAWRTLWWVFLLGPILSAMFGLYLCQKDSSDALVPVALMYVLDVLLLYWVTTASSSPGHTKHLPPGSFLLRQLFDPR